MKKFTKHGLFVGIAVLLTAALALASCSNGGGDTGNPPPPPVKGYQLKEVTVDTVDDVDVWTVTTTNYTGSPGPLSFNLGTLPSGIPVTGNLPSVGSISSGKLTLTIPATVPDGKLADLSSYEPGLRGSALLMGNLHLVAGTNEVVLVYFSKDATVEGTSVSKGWNYSTTSGAPPYSSAVPGGAVWCYEAP